MSTDRMLNQWSQNLGERTSIESFLEWLGERNIGLVDLEQGGNWTAPLASRSALLDEYHEIDRAQLDRERRALLEKELAR